MVSITTKSGTKTRYWIWRVACISMIFKQTAECRSVQGARKLQHDYCSLLCLLCKGDLRQYTNMTGTCWWPCIVSFNNENDEDIRSHFLLRQYNACPRTLQFLRERRICRFLAGNHHGNVFVGQGTDDMVRHLHSDVYACLCRAQCQKERAQTRQTRRRCSHLGWTVMHVLCKLSVRDNWCADCSAATLNLLLVYSVLQ